MKKQKINISNTNKIKEQHHTQVVTHHSGPLPPAESLRKYEEILPGITDRIMTMTENDIDHTQKINLLNIKLNNKGLNLAYSTAILGQVLSFVIMLIFLVCGFILIYLNKPFAGTMFSSVSAISAIGSLIYQFIQKRRK